MEIHITVLNGTVGESLIELRRYGENHHQKERSGLDTRHVGARFQAEGERLRRGLRGTYTVLLDSWRASDGWIMDDR